MPVIMGLDTTPYEDSQFDSSQLICEPNFGPHLCNGFDGIFGSKFTNPTNSTTGLWTLWLWLPERSHASYFNYNLQQGDEAVVFVGTYLHSGTG